MSFTHRPRGPFDLLNANSFFGGWPSPAADERAIVVCMPVEGWEGSAAVVLRQGDDGMITGEVVVDGQGDELAARAFAQALQTLSLDIDGSGWPAAGERDPFIGELQASYHHLRPVLFHSPYEAAAAFLIGHRISIAQRQAIMKRIARRYGDELVVGGEPFHAFPRPQIVLALDAIEGLNAEKLARLQDAARAAVDGWLERAALLALPIDEALARIATLRGVGPFFASGILMRGAGVVDDVPDDDNTKVAVQHAYGLERKPGRAEVLQRAEAWSPYRMWATVLLHVWVRRERGGFRRP